MASKGTRINKTIQKGKNKTGGLTLPNFKTHSETPLRQYDSVVLTETQINKIGESKNKPTQIRSKISDTGRKPVDLRKRNIFSKQCESTGACKCK